MVNSDLKARIDDWLIYASKSKKFITSPFFNEIELAECIEYIGNNDYIISGGHENATRKMIGFNGDPSLNISCMVAKYNSKFRKISHKDVFGALMSLRISKDKIGDILIFDDKIVIYIHKDNELDIEMILNKINQVKTSFYKSDINYTKEIEFKTYHKTIASLRLDAIVSTFTNLTRNKAQALIKGSKVRINHQTIEDNDAICHNNDTISITGYGRFKFIDIINKTKKGNLLIEYIKYI